EGPAGDAQMVLVGVFDHRHLELARQAHNGGDGEPHRGQPAAVKTGGSIHGQTTLGGETENTFKATADIDDEDANSDERGELDHGLKGDGGDDAVMLLLGIN